MKFFEMAEQKNNFDEQDYGLYCCLLLQIFGFILIINFAILLMKSHNKNITNFIIKNNNTNITNIMKNSVVENDFDRALSTWS
jgi:hypothetical protein